MNIPGDRRVSDIIIADVLKTNCLYENIYFWTEGDNGPTKFYLLLQAFNSQVSTAHANIPKVSHIEENREQDSERKVEEHVELCITSHTTHCAPFLVNSCIR